MNPSKDRGRFSVLTKVLERQWDRGTVLLSPLPLKVGSRTLASYSYTQDQNRYLQQMTYGNGDNRGQENRPLVPLVQTKGVMALKGAIYDCGGPLTGVYAKEVALTKGYQYLYNVWLM